MSSVTAKSSMNTKRQLSTDAHGAKSANGDEHASKYANVSRVLPHSIEMRGDRGAGTSTCPAVSTRISTKQVPPTVACLTAATCTMKSCPCKNRSACVYVTLLNHCLFKIANPFLCATIDAHTPPRAPWSFMVLLLAMVIYGNTCET